MSCFYLAVDERFKLPLNSDTGSWVVRVFNAPFVRYSNSIDYESHRLGDGDEDDDDDRVPTPDWVQSISGPSAPATRLLDPVVPRKTARGRLSARNPAAAKIFSAEEIAAADAEVAAIESGAADIAGDAAADEASDKEKCDEVVYAVLTPSDESDEEIAKATASDDSSRPSSRRGQCEEGGRTLRRCAAAIGNTPMEVDSASEGGSEAAMPAAVFSAAGAAIHESPVSTGGLTKIPKTPAPLSRSRPSLRERESRESRYKDEEDELLYPSSQKGFEGWGGSSL